MQSEPRSRKNKKKQEDKQRLGNPVRKNVVRVALTGNIGSGKSTVAKMFSELEVPTFDTDKVGHELLESDAHIQSRIIEIFGRAVVLDGLISRHKLARIVFDNPSRKAQLESILHPAIMSVIRERSARVPNVSYVLVEVPLLYEAGLADEFRYVILVKSNKKTAVERAAKNLGLDKEEIMKRLETQMPQTTKEKLADFVISNDGSFEELKERVLLIHSIISSIGCQATESD